VSNGDDPGRAARLAATLRAAPGWLGWHAKTVLRIGRWEVTKSAGTVNRTTVVLALLGTLLGVAVGPAVVAEGVGLDRGIYRVGIDEDSDYRRVVEFDERFVGVETTDRDALRSGRVDVLVTDERIVIDGDRRKSRAAYAAFRSSIQAYNDAALREEVAAGGNESAAFPVRVTLSYRERIEERIAVEADADGGGTDGGTGGSDGGDGGGGAVGGTDGSDGASTGDGADDGSQGDGGGFADLGEGLFTGSDEGSPSDISPPFPFASLILAFAFIVPMNFVIQAYGSSIMEERLNRRGELLLVSPVSPGDIIAGKTLPYFAVLALVTTGIAVAVGGSYVSVAAVLPIALLFLSATFVGGMFARSFKELSFVTVSISVFLTAYVFVPAIFTDIVPIALISPLTIVVRDLRGASVALGEYAFSTGPFLLSSTVLFALGAGVYREEDMFTQRPVHLKALDALASRVHSPRSVLGLGAALVPFVFVVELLAVALLFVLPVQLSVPLLLAAIAVIEEVAKSVHVFAGYTHARFDRSLATAVVVGTFAGAGFFLGEKLVLLSQVVGLPDLRLGRTAFGAGAGGGELALDPLLVVGFLFAPLVLHVVTATVSAVGASRNARAWVAAMAISVVLHVAYNLTVVSQIAG